MRTTLDDRPGSLALLAGRCGFGGVNILSLQVFPGVDSVTDELVISAPEEWGVTGVAELVETAGGRDVSVSACTAHALVDATTRYLLAARHVVTDPSSAEEALTDLLDGDEGQRGALLSELEVLVGATTVTVRRTAPFTDTERARATAFGLLVSDMIDAETVTLAVTGDEPVLRLATAGDALALVRMGERCSTRTLDGRFGAPLVGIPVRMVRRLLAEGPALVAEVGGEIVGLATLTTTGEPEVSLLVEDGWQGKGVGTKLLGTSARLAKARGALELVLRGGEDVVRLSAASGLMGRLRQNNGEVVLTVSLRRVAPLLQNVEGAVGLRPLDPAPA
ncbi:MAG TPA: GNAT family N-acetyltransferase [Nocardioidaceae bacterium]|nr:GNAT family N-acetyltransferase [Nocardioidaceae bacterium]